MKNFTELYSALDNNKIDYLEIFNEFVPRIEEPYLCIGAVEDVGEGWLFTWGAGGDGSIPNIKFSKRDDFIDYIKSVQPDLKEWGL